VGKGRARTERRSRTSVLRASALAARSESARAARQKPRLSVHLPIGEIDAAGERHLSGLVRVLCPVRGSRTMFSMPLAYSSTLDRRPPVAHTCDGFRPTWRSFGARASRVVLKNSRLKQVAITSCVSSAQR
jgi:hypothetical protein